MGDYISIDDIEYKKKLFIFNALQDGWTINKMDDSYIFKKKHENKREVFTDKYLQTFVYKNITLV